MREDELGKVASLMPTPFYVYDTDVFEEEIRYLKKELGSGTQLTYSMKANPFLVKKAEPLVSRIEVCSFGEFQICRELRIPPEKLLISGVLKKREDLMEIVRYAGSSAIYTAESPGQLRLLEAAGHDRMVELPVLLRLTSGNQFGMDEETVLEIWQTRAKYPHLFFAGIHYFSGTGKKNFRKTGRELTKLDLLLRKIYEITGNMPSMLEYGTGFAVPYFRTDGISEKETEEKERQAGCCRSATAEDSMREFRELLGHMNYNGRIVVEMGRAVAWNCGTYLTRIEEVKKTGDTKYCIVDGGIHQMNYDGQMLGMYLPKTDVIRENCILCDDENEKEIAQTQSVVGSLCTPADILIRDYQERSLHEGDILAFRNTGAYSMDEGMSLLLSHELPAVCFFSREQGLTVVRKQMDGYRFHM